MIEGENRMERERGGIKENNSPVQIVEK